MEVIILLLVFALIAVRMSVKISAKAKNATKASSGTESLWNFVFEQEEQKNNDEFENVEVAEENTETVKRKVENVVVQNKEMQDKKENEQSELKEKFPLRDAVIYSTILDRPYK